MTGWYKAGVVVAAYGVGVVVFMGVKHWIDELPWPQAALEASVWALVPLVVGLVAGWVQRERS
ncbi:hypothetical protein DEJ49_20110 [Streptomyces venezuelae]|uniref:Uncharacterized protein n=1 Tax=Streptomyces venezuelae TaxID=54571 RepID=A0A5P2CJF1_STRVZ|nr:hypothetical protein [Streptomyces venezuelae]QES42976.1 hypothetical protein DEJ49_20110 [Streptomyces venezuelae]